MIARLEASQLKGKLKIMPSKSMGHRLMICAALAGGGRVDNINPSRDMLATIGALSSLGYGLSYEGQSVKALGNKERNREIFCDESGSTLRFLLPLALLEAEEAILTGQGRLLERPMGIYEEICKKNGIFYEHSKEGIKIKGRLKSGEYQLRGDVSSQFITGLLFALPLVHGSSIIKITTDLESRAYVDLTLDAMKIYGVNAEFKGNQIFIEGNQSYKATNSIVEGDYSHAAFFACAGMMGDICLSGLKYDSLQGDKKIIEILQRMGGDIAWHDGLLYARKSQLTGIEIDASQCPDLVPVLAAIACMAKGQTRIYNAARLRIKESDRLASMAEELNKIGGKIHELSDGLLIEGTEELIGGATKSHNDHRVAMALAIAAGFCTEVLEISDAQCVNKSAPAFFDELLELGQKLELLQNGIE